MRGVPQIEVTFDIDVNGILNVSAKDLATGKEQSITITASSNMSDKDIERAMEDAKAYESEDQEKRDAIGSYNEGENMLYKGEAYLAQHKKELSRETFDETDQTTKYYRRTRQSDQRSIGTCKSVDTIGKCLDRLY